jgi:phage shock protein PspC (stress-responsive transcriptional regulator)
MSDRRSHRLVRPKQDRMIAGVAAGLADRFGISRGTMRLLFVLTLILPGPQILIYIVLWIIIPEEE